MAVASAERKDPAEGELGRSVIGNLAAMAAAAAANRGKLKAERPDLGGLAAMAAAAAAKREQKMAMSSNADTAMTKGGSKEVVGNQSPDKGGMLGRLDLGGLASMAAMVANKREQKKAGDQGSETTAAEQEPSLAGRFAALSAEAATARSDDQERSFGQGDMAAMAAEAARKRKQTQTDASEASVAAPKPSMGDVAGMVAAAALKRTQDRRTIETSTESASNESAQAQTVGDISSEAAAAKRTQSNKEWPNLGGIAFMASMAAKHRAQLKSEAMTGTPSGSIGSNANLNGAQSTSQHEIKLAPPSAVPPKVPFIGIAAMAAATKRTNDQRLRPELGGETALGFIGGPERHLETGGSSVLASGDSTSTGTDTLQPLASGASISDGMMNLANADQTPGLMMAMNTGSTTILAERAKLGSLGHIIVAEEGPDEVARNAAAKKRSSSDDECGDDNSSAGESTSSKKLKSSPHLNLDHVERILDFQPAKVVDSGLRNDITMEFLRGDDQQTDGDSFDDPTIGKIPRFPDDAVQPNGHSEVEGKAKESFATAESIDGWIENQDEVRARTMSSAHLSSQMSLSVSTCSSDASFGEGSRKGKGQKGKKKKMKKKKNSRGNTLNSEKSVPDVAHNAGGVVDEKADSEISRQKVFTGDSTQMKFKRSRKQLSPLRSEAYVRTHPIERDDTIDDTIERFIVTLDDEVAAIGNALPATETPPIDEGLKVASSAKPPPGRDQTLIRETSHESSMKDIPDDKNDGGNPLQRWFQSLGASKDFRGTHTSQGKLEEETPASAPKHDKDTDNLFANIFRQIGGQESSTKSLTTEPIAPPEDKKT